MLIDWFTVIAQIINFLILIALLKHFLYGRILNAMDERESGIARRLEEAEQKNKDAEQERASWHDKNSDLEQNRKERLEQVEKEVQSTQKEQEKKMRADIDRMRDQWIEKLQRDQDSFLRELREQAGSRIADAARLALESLANAGLEKQIISVFIEHLRGVEEDDTGEIAEVFEAHPTELTVRSSFDIADEDRKALNEVIRSRTGEETEVRYENDRDLIAGIELAAGGRKISWNILRFMDSLGDALQSALQSVENSPADDSNEQSAENGEEQT